MKKFIRIASVLAATMGALMFVGCTKDFSEDIDQLEKRVKTLEDDTAVESLQSKISSLESLSSSFVKLSQYTSDLAALNATVSGNTSELGTLKTNIEKISADLTSFKALVGASDIDFETSLSKINDALKDYAKTSDVDSKIGDLTDAIAGVKAMFADYTPASSFAELSKQFSELSKVVSDNKDAISANAGDIAALETLIDGAQAAIDALALTVKDEDGKLAQAIADEIAKRTGADEELETAIAAAKKSLQNQIDAIETIDLPAIKASLDSCLRVEDFEAAKEIAKKNMLNEIGKVSAALEILEGVVDGNKTDSENADSKLQTLIDELDGNIDDILGTIATLATKTELETAVDEIEGKIDFIISTIIPGVQSAVNNNFNTLSGRINDIVEDINEMQDILDSKATISALELTKTALQTTIGENWKAFTEFKAAQEALNDGYDSSLEEYGEAIETLEGRVDLVEGRLDTIEAWFSGTDETELSNIKSVRAQIAKINSTIDDINKQLNLLENKVDNLYARVSSIVSVPQRGVELVDFFVSGNHNYYVKATFAVRPAEAAANLTNENTSLYVKNGLDKSKYVTAAPTNIADSSYPINKVVNNGNGEVVVYARVNCYEELEYDIASYYSLEFKGSEEVDGETSNYYVMSDFIQASKNLDEINIRLASTYVAVNDEGEPMPREMSDSAVYTDHSKKFVLNTDKNHIGINFIEGKSFMTISEINDCYGIALRAIVGVQEDGSEKISYSKDSTSYNYYIKENAGKNIAESKELTIYVKRAEILGGSYFTDTDSVYTANFKILPEINTDLALDMRQAEWDWRQCDTVAFDTLVVTNRALYNIVKQFGENPEYVVFDDNSTALSNSIDPNYAEDSCRIYVPAGAKYEVIFNGKFPMSVEGKTVDTTYTFSGLAGWTAENKPAEAALDSILYKFNYTYTLAKRPSAYLNLSSQFNYHTLFLGSDKAIKDTLKDGKYRGVIASFINSLDKYYNYSYDNMNDILSEYSKSEFIDGRSYVPGKNPDADASYVAYIEMDGNNSIYTSELSCKKYGTYWFYDSTYVFGVKHKIGRKVFVNQPKTHLLSPITEYIGEDLGNKNFEVEVKNYVQDNEFKIDNAQLAHYFKLTNKATQEMEDAYVHVSSSVDAVAGDHIDYPEELSISVGSDRLSDGQPLFSWNDLGKTSFYNYVRLVDGYDNMIDSLTIKFWTKDPVAEEITVKSIAPKVPSTTSSTDVTLTNYVDIAVNYNLLEEGSSTTPVSTTMFATRMEEDEIVYVCPTIFGADPDHSDRGFTFAIAEESQETANDLGLTISGSTLTLPMDHAVLTDDVTVKITATFTYRFGTRTTDFNVVFTPGE